MSLLEKHSGVVDETLTLVEYQVDLTGPVLIAFAIAMAGLGFALGYVVGHRKRPRH